MKKVTLVCLILMVVALFSGCGQINPSEQAKLTLVDNGVEVSACGDHPVKVEANLLIDANGTAQKEQFESQEECTLQPGESVVLTYDNPSCTVIDLLSYDIKLLPMKFDLDIIFWITLGIWVIISLIVSFVDDLSSGAFVALFSIIVPFMVTFIARLILYVALSGPVDFYLFGSKFFM